MKGIRLTVGASAVALFVLLTGCAQQTDSLGDMGCRTTDEYLPEFDAVAAGAQPTEDLYDRVVEEVRLDYFDDETRSLFKLLADGVVDPFGESYTPIEIDYDDIRSRLIEYCELDMDWAMSNA